jgi:hypothetical protein
VPIDPSAAGVGEPCHVEGSAVTGVDDCAPGSTCWGVDPDTLTGTCVALCVGEGPEASCDDAQATCIVANDGVLPLCLPTCDPLHTAGCPDGAGCYPIGNDFVCLQVGIGVVDGAATCKRPTDCEPGTACLDDAITESCTDPPCCAAWCDHTLVDADEACGDGMLCQPYHGIDAPAGQEHLGLCVGA